jgi:hypothetical protein
MDSDLFHTILNLKIHSRTAKSVLDKIGEKPIKNSPLETYLYYSYKNSGIEVRIQTPENLIKHIAMVTGNFATDLSEFTGELPENLRFGDSSTDVETKLGCAFMTSRWPDRDSNWQKKLIYHREKYSVSLDFDKNDELVRVAFGELDTTWATKAL